MRDRGAKKLSYAAAGIEEYWIINVYEKQVERFTEPNPEKGTFEQMNIFKAGGRIESLHLGTFQVDDLLVS
jgi:Uma2 family endonuclease